MLVITFPDEYSPICKEIGDMLDKYYDEWHNPETAPYPHFAQYSCLEEYMVDRLSERYGMWTTWDSEYYGEGDE